MVLARTKTVRTSFENVKRHLDDIEEVIKMSISKEEVKALLEKIRDMERKIFDMRTVHEHVAHLSEKVKSYPDEAIKILSDKVKNNIDYFEKRLEMLEKEFIAKMDSVKDHVAESQKKNLHRMRDFLEEKLSAGQHADFKDEIRALKRELESQSKEILSLKKALANKK